jgi:hypothetical protein
MMSFQLHRLDDDPVFWQMQRYEPDLNQLTDPQQFARWQTASRCASTISRSKGAARMKHRPFRRAA